MEGKKSLLVCRGENYSTMRSKTVFRSSILSTAVTHVGVTWFNFK